MKFYKMSQVLYCDIWSTLQENKEYMITYHEVDAWLLNNYGLKATRKPRKDIYFLFEVLDEQKLVMFELKWS